MWFAYHGSRAGAGFNPLIIKDVTLKMLVTRNIKIRAEMPRVKEAKESAPRELAGPLNDNKKYPDPIIPEVLLASLKKEKRIVSRSTV